MGIGRALMNFAENLAKEKGCIGTWLVTDLDREEEAHKFYKELGYRVNGYRFVKPFGE
jgi:GNAT superfamily N-acetyltransferase